MQELFLSQTAESAEKLLASIANLSENQVHFKAAENIWSVLECLEHIFVVEAGIIKTLRIESQSNEGAESVVNRGKVEEFLQNRGFKIDAPDFTAPKGRFKSLEELKAAFLTKRQELNMLMTTTNLLDGVLVKHPKLGDMTKTDWVHFLIQHTNRHIEQVVEIKSHANFPVA
jgi:uncharacterized damage-inducible protein DinB